MATRDALINAPEGELMATNLIEGLNSALRRLIIEGRDGVRRAPVVSEPVAT